MDVLQRLKRRLIRKLSPALDARSPFFRRFPADGRLTLVNSRTLVDLRRRFVYSRVPKAANSSVVASLYMNAKEAREVGSVEHFKTGDIKPSKLTAAQVNDVLVDFKKFTFVRNPYTRIASCYLDKFTRPHPVGEKARRAMRMPKGAEVSFGRFLDFISTDFGRGLDAHWARQVDIMAFPVDLYDFIGTVEAIDTDLPKLLGFLGMSKPAVRFTPHKTKSREFIAALSSAELLKIQEIYSRDFESFGYSWNPSEVAARPFS